jgi:hypothetical protein
MNAMKATILMSLALVFDVLKFMATQLWIFGPALVGGAAGVAVASQYGALAGKAAGLITGAASGAAELIPGVAAGVELIGVILALAIGLLGWLILITVMASFRIRFFKGESRNFLRLFVGFLVSEIPLIDALPSFTVSTWLIIRGEYKAQKEAKAKYDAEYGAFLKQQQRTQNIEQKQLLQLQAAQIQAEQDEQDLADADAAEQEAIDAEEAESPEESADEIASEPLYGRQPLVGVPSLTMRPANNPRVGA